MSDNNVLHTVIGKVQSSDDTYVIAVTPAIEVAEHVLRFVQENPELEFTDEEGNRVLIEEFILTEENYRVEGF